MDGFDGDMGICGDMLGFASHVEVCGIAGIWGYAGICGICGDMRDMRDGPPPRNHPGRAAVFGAAPPIQEGRKMGTENNQRSKKECLFLI